MTNPLEILSNLSKPLVKLVEVVESGIGKLYEPVGTVRQAKADAESKLIDVQARIDAVGLVQRSKLRFSHVEVIRQQNIEQIIVAAACELPSTVNETTVDPDWVNQFFGHAQDVSNEKMQILWGKILAGEVASPDTYSKRTLHFLKTLDKFEADMFTQVCRLILRDTNRWGIIYEIAPTLERLSKANPNFGFIRHFASIGLIDTEQSLKFPSKSKMEKLDYFGRTFVFASEIADIQKNQRSLASCFGVRYLTQIGQELFTISGAEPIPDYPGQINEFLRKEHKTEFREVSK